MNTIEEKLWNYIDGNCSPDDAAAIAQLIEQDLAYHKKYNELLQLNNEFAAIEIDEPPMAFTYNVMEVIRTENAMKPLKARIDGRIIWGIAAFFIVTVATLLVYAISTVNWSVTHEVSIPVKVDTVKVTGILSGPIGKAFLFFDVILGLFLFDAWLRRRDMTKA